MSNQEKAGAEIDTYRELRAKGAQPVCTMNLPSPIGRGAGERVERRRACFTTLAKAGWRVAHLRVCRKNSSSPAMGRSTKNIIKTICYNDKSFVHELAKCCYADSVHKN